MLDTWCSTELCHLYVRADTTMPWCKKGWLAGLLELRHRNSAYRMTWTASSARGLRPLVLPLLLSGSWSRAGWLWLPCLLARDQGGIPRFMWSYQDLQIIKAHFAENGLDVLPNAGINSSTIHAALSKENKRSWKRSWASSVLKTTH